MDGYSTESWKQLISCDSRLQRLLVTVAEEVELSVVKGFHPESEFCPTKEVTILPSISHYPQDQRPICLMAFIGYLEGVAKGLGYKIVINSSKALQLGISDNLKSLPESDFHLTLSVLETD